MTDADRLAAIRARCVLISRQDYRPDTSLPSGLPSTTVAMALSTIAGIDLALEIREHLLAEFGDGWRCEFVDDKIKAILDAWE